MQARVDRFERLEVLALLHRWRAAATPRAAPSDDQPDTAPKESRG